MSNWTHISAIVRLDNMLLAMIMPEKLKAVNVIRDLHGQKPIDPVQEAIDNVLEHFNKEVPTGSEGPLNIALHVWPTSEDFDLAGGTTHLFKGSMYWADIIISGDLRDFDDPFEVEDWLRERCDDLPKGMMVRCGAFHAYSEAGETSTMFHDGESWSARS